MIFFCSLVPLDWLVKTMPDNVPFEIRNNIFLFIFHLYSNGVFVLINNKSCFAPRSYRYNLLWPLVWWMLALDRYCCINRCWSNDILYPHGDIVVGQLHMELSRSSSCNMKSNSNCSNLRLFSVCDSGVWKLTHGFETTNGICLNVPIILNHRAEKVHCKVTDLDKQSWFT